MGYTDFHSHVLPGADHGSGSLETSMFQIHEAVAAGVTNLFATPHFYVNEDNIHDFLIRRDKCFDKLTAQVKKEKIKINIHKSAEVNLQLGLTDLPDLEKLCIENTKYMLLEMPFEYKWQPWAYNAIDELRNRGIEPIIAHIDRYDDDLLDRLFDFDVMMQINAESLTSFFGRRRILQYVEGGFIYFLGSDIHQHGKQYDYYKKAVKILGEKRVQKFHKNAKARFPMASYSYKDK